MPATTPATVTSAAPVTGPAPATSAALPGQRWSRVVVVVLARAYLAFVLGGLLWSGGPALLGWHATVVSSGSMAPRLPVGAVLVSAPAAATSLRLGNVVLVHDPAVPGRLLSHRLVGRDADGQLLTRGDANGQDDSTPVPTAGVIGIGRLLVPYAGLPVLWMQTGQILPLGLWLLLTAGAVALTGWDRRTRSRRPGPERPVGGGGPTPRRRSGPRLRPASAALVVVALAAGHGLASAPPQLALAAFSAVTSNPGNSFALDPAAQFGPGNYAAAVAADSPLLFWKLNQSPASGTAPDSSTAATNTGTYSTTGVTGNQAGPFARETSKSVLFDGTSGCVRGTTTANLSSLSVEAWFKTTTILGGKIIGYGNSNTTASSGSYDRHIYMTNAGKLAWGVYPNATSIVLSAGTYNDGQWHHVVGTVGAGSQQTLYVDGAANGTPLANTGVQSYAGYLHVGCDNLNGWATAATGPVTNTFFAGNVANAAVYPSALTAAKVAAHYYAA